MREFHTSPGGGEQFRVPARHFVKSADLRATSDPLWNALHRFREAVVQQSTYAPAVWTQMLLDIRTAADDSGLHPSFPRSEHIVLIGAEEWKKCELLGDPEDFPARAFPVVLLQPGPGGWVQDSDLVDSFKGAEGNGNIAIEWAERWINAREVQLAVAPAVSAKPNHLPTSADLRHAADISDDTFRRIRTLAGLDNGQRGAKARNRQYAPDEVERLCQAVLAGPFLNQQEIARKWSQWKPQVSRIAASKPHAQLLD